MKLINLKAELAHIELKYVRMAMFESRQNVAMAAKLLGLKRTTLVMKLKKYKAEGKAIS